MSNQTQTVKMKRKSDHKGSVRFDAPEGVMPPPAVGNVYVSRAMPGINEAQSIEVTITITEAK